MTYPLAAGNNPSKANSSETRASISLHKIARIIMPDSDQLTEIENAKYLVTIEEALLNIEIIVAVQSSLLFFAYVPQLIFRLSVLIM